MNPLIMSPFSHSMRRFTDINNFVGKASAVNNGLNSNPLTTDDFLCYLPKSRDDYLSIKKDMGQMVIFQVSNIYSWPELPFRAFTTDTNTIKTIFSDYNAPFNDWVSKQRGYAMVVSWYIRHNNLFQSKDPIMLLTMQYLIEPTAPVRSGISEAEFVSLAKTHRFGICDQHVPPVIGCMNCCGCGLEHDGWTIADFKLQDGKSHCQLISHKHASTKLLKHKQDYDKYMRKRETVNNSYGIITNINNDDNYHDMSLDNDMINESTSDNVSNNDDNSDTINID